MKNVLERLLNLLACLLTAGRPVTADEIRHTVAGYEDKSDEAFHRMFERDKDLLREMGSACAERVRQRHLVTTEAVKLSALFSSRAGITPTAVH